MQRRASMIGIVGLALGFAGPASALSLSTPSLVNGTTLVYNGSGTASATGDKFAISGTQTISSGATAFSTRYWTDGAADVGAFGSTRGVTATNTYTISFNVTHTNGANYWLYINTSILGALTTLDDGGGGDGTAADAAIGNVAGSRTGGGSLSGTLALSSAAGQVGGGGTNNTVVNKTGSAVIANTGTGAAQAYTLTFTFTSKANSTCSGLCITGGDEKAYRFGLSTATGLGAITTTGTTGVSVDDYGGVGARNGLNDGHFVNLTLVPEPGTLVLLGAGLAGLALTGSRKRS